MSAAQVDHDGPDRPITTETQERLTLANSIAASASTLPVADLRVLAWMVRQLPGERLRASCEEATARGWCSAGEKRVVVQTSPEEHARGELLSLVRHVARIVLGREHPEVRKREAVLADEVARRTPVPGLVKAGGR